MSALLYAKPKLGLWDRIKLAYKLLIHNSFSPIIRFDNGVEIDLSSNKIILNNPTEILSKETFRIISKKHLILSSGKDKDPLRPGYLHSIWENPDLDESNNPIWYQVYVHTKTGHIHKMKIEFDEAGKEVIPEGFEKFVR